MTNPYTEQAELVWLNASQRPTPVDIIAGAMRDAVETDRQRVASILRDRASAEDDAYGPGSDFAYALRALALEVLDPTPPLGGHR